MDMLTSLTTLLFLSALMQAGSWALLFDDDMDCTLSPWTRWSQPSNFGMRYRERKVLRYPSGNGKECPIDLHEEEEVEINNQSTAPFPIEVMGNIIIDNFLRPEPIGGRKRGSNPIGLLRDLLLIVDSSYSIGQAEFQTSLLELTSLLSVMCPEPEPFDLQYNRAALLEFSSRVYERFDFDDNPTHSQVMSAIRNIQYVEGSTCTGDAFDNVPLMFKRANGSRTDNPKGVKAEVLIITDGESNCGSDAITAAKRVQSIADVYALVIGTPSAQGKAELSSYVSTPITKHLFNIPSYSELTDLVAFVLNQLKTHPKNPCLPFNIGK